MAAATRLDQGAVYVGHVGIALAAKGWRRELPLWLLVLASQGCDWLDTALDPGGIGKQTSLWSHSLPSVLAGSLVAMLLARGMKAEWPAARVVALVYASHYAVDLLTGTKPTWPGGPTIGLAGYGFSTLDFVVETTVILAGWLVYTRTLGARRNSGVAMTLVVVLVALQALADVALSRTVHHSLMR